MNFCDQYRFFQDFWGRSVYASCCPDGVCLFDPRAISLSCHSCGATSSIDPEDVILSLFSNYFSNFR